MYLPEIIFVALGADIGHSEHPQCSIAYAANLPVPLFT